MVKPDRPQVTIWRMRVACCIPKTTHIQKHTTTHTHTEYVILIAFPRKQRLCERTPMLRYTYGACLVMLLNTIFWNSANVVYS